MLMLLDYKVACRNAWKEMHVNERDTWQHVSHQIGSVLVFMHQCWMTYFVSHILYIIYTIYDAVIRILARYWLLTQIIIKVKKKKSCWKLMKHVLYFDAVFNIYISGKKVKMPLHFFLQKSSSNQGYSTEYWFLNSCCSLKMNVILFSWHCLRSENIFFIILTICHFLKLNALNDNLFILNLKKNLVSSL